MMGLMLMDMAEADANRDGSVSKAEFVGYQLRFFDAGDANGDGKIAVPPPPPEPPQPPEAPDLPEPPAPPKR